MAAASLGRAGPERSRLGAALERNALLKAKNQSDLIPLVIERHFVAQLTHKE